jgi:hypothetical protein
MIPTRCLGLWLKDHPHASQAHRVLRYDRDVLVSYCGRMFPVGEASRSEMCVKLCPDCMALVRKRDADQLKALAEKFGRRKSYVAQRE